MKHIQLVFLLLLISCFATSTLLAQSVAKADKAYEGNGYAEAIDLYLASISKDKDAKVDRKSMIRLANSYRLIGDYQNAEKWYSQIVESSRKAKYRLFYAQALQSNGKCELAKKYFLEYHELIMNDSTNLDFDVLGNLDGRGKTLAEGCETDFPDNPQVEVKNLASINSDKLDMSPTYYKGGIVFASNRGIDRLKSNTDSWLDEPFIDLFVAENTDDGGFTTPVPFSRTINSRFHEGPASFDRLGNIMYFTRNNLNGSKRVKNSRGQTKLKIYSAEWDEEEWGNIKELPFNSDQRSVCHPSLAVDGSTLYFSTDRPGGFGGMDIYVSYFREGRWTKPKNLGPEVNTRGNEVFPFIHDDGTLYFSSNGHQGIGGLDILSVQHVELGDTAFWAGVKNLGRPFNTTQDDFGFILDIRKKSGYFSSNRPGGKGSDDIYSFRMPPGQELKIEAPRINWVAKVQVSDRSTRQAIEGAKVTISNCGTSGGFTARLVPVEGKSDEFTLRIIKGGYGDGSAENALTDIAGEVRYDLEGGMDYCFTAEKDGYEIAEKKFSTHEYDTDREVKLKIFLKEKPTCTEVSGTVYNKRYNSSIPDATITIVNKYTGESETIYSDDKGRYDACLVCNALFTIKGEKKEVGFITKEFFAAEAICGKKQGMDLLLEEPPKPKEEKKEMEELSEVNPYIGQKVILENIFYEYNKAVISPSSEKDLDKLARIMKAYPSLVIELASHTDSRGSRGYNNNLSQKRADEAVKYLMRQGINRERLSAKGYGESEPVVECRNKENCSEEDHQANRRTEFRILRFDESIDIKGLFESQK